MDATDQSHHLGEQEWQLQEMNKQIQQPVVAHAQVTTQYTAPVALPTPVTPAQPLVTQPDKFTGEPSQCWGFLFQCHLYFSVQVDVSDQAKMLQFLSLLTDKALSWTIALWERKGGQECLLAMKQGRRRAAEYALEFHRLAAESSWNELALKATVLPGTQPRRPH